MNEKNKSDGIQAKAANEPCQDPVRVCVIVSYWTGHPARNLKRLLGSFKKHSAKHQYDLKIICNGGDAKPLRASEAPAAAKIVNRENTGFNLGAWDAGWRDDTSYDFYLFLQDECYARKEGWLERFVYRMKFDKRVGLLGESIMWDRLGWDFIEEDTRRTLKEGYLPVSEIWRHLCESNVAPGQDGSHLQSLVWFVRGPLILETGGIPHSNKYLEAVASEVLFSRALVEKGWGISQISSKRFEYIAHSQWTGSGRVLRAFRNVLSAFKRNILGG